VWRHFFGLGAAISSLVLVLHVVSLSAEFSEPKRHTYPVQKSHLTVLDRGMDGLPTLWGEAAAVFFMVDAVRRKYRGSRATALAHWFIMRSGEISHLSRRLAYFPLDCVQNV